MNEWISPVTAFALGITLAWLAGMRVYLTVFGVGLAGLFGWMPVPESMSAITSPWLLLLCLAMALIEFMADKLPGVDTVWDLIHTLVRIPAGAFVGGLAFANGDELSTAGMVGGGAIALLSHGLKTSARAAINASPEPVSNVLVSSSEDAVSVTALGLLLAHPFLSLGLLIFCTGIVLLAIYGLHAIMRAPGAAAPIST